MIQEDNTRKDFSENSDEKKESFFEFRDIRENKSEEDTFLKKLEKSKIDDRSIGQILREARVEQEIAFDSIYDTTKIRRKFIEALENDDFHALPNLLVARGYIKIYADCLKLEVAPLIKKFNILFPEEAVGSNGPRGNNEGVIGKTVSKKNLIPNALKNMNSSSLRYTSQLRIRNNKKVISGTLMSVGFVVFAILMSNLYFKNSIGSIKNQPRQKSAVEDLEAKLTPEEVMQRKSEYNKVYISAKALGRTYVSVVMDGRLVFKGYFNRGESKFWEADQYIRLKSSVPKYLELVVNGEQSGIMADQTSALEKTYYPQKDVKSNTEIVTEPAKNDETYEEPKVIEPKKVLPIVVTEDDPQAAESKVGQD